MLFGGQIQILFAEKQFVLYNIYKNNFARISPGIVFKLPFMVFLKMLWLRISCTLYY